MSFARSWGFLDIRKADREKVGCLRAGQDDETLVRQPPYLLPSLRTLDIFLLAGGHFFGGESATLR